MKKFKDDGSSHNRISIEDIKILINVNDQSSLKDQRIISILENYVKQVFQN